MVAAFLGGAWVGYDYRDAKAGREKAAQAVETSRALERSMERRAAADEALAGVQSAVAAALRKPYASQIPVKCPDGADARSVVLPGLGERLRSIDAASSGGAGADLAVMPEPGASDSGR